ncbi:MAG: hypothetical protein ACE149_10880 [Armatimonadota bacterium]
MGRSTPTLGYFLGLLSGTVLGYAWAEDAGLAVIAVGILVAVLSVLVIVHAFRSPAAPRDAEADDKQENWDWSAAPPLGQMLVNYGLITPANLNRALDRQRKSPKRLGKTLVEMGLLNYQQVAEVLEEQLSRRAHKSEASEAEPSPSPGQTPTTG